MPVGKESFHRDGYLSMLGDGWIPCCSGDSTRIVGVLNTRGVWKVGIWKILYVSLELVCYGNSNRYDVFINRLLH